MVKRMTSMKVYVPIVLRNVITHCAIVYKSPSKFVVHVSSDVTKQICQSHNLCLKYSLEQRRLGE